MNEAKLFYETLYSSSGCKLLGINIESELEGYSILKLNNEESTSMEGLKQ